MTYKVVLPSDFDEYGSIVEAKGWFAGALVEFDGRAIELLFYDPTRLNQEIEDDHSANRIFYERNIIVVPTVTRESIEASVKFLYESGELGRWKESSGNQ
jgi:hypothetical protein